MGTGYMFECKKCKYQYGIYPGIGFSYMSLCKKTLDKIAKGKYGKEFKAAYDNGGRKCTKGSVYVRCLQNLGFCD